MFQSTIVKKYITTQNSDELISKWDLFKTFFHDIGNQNRIRELKEEQFQEGFLDKLFVEVFGYIKKPLENYNLVTELKNPNDSRKVDGGIIFNEVVKCVIELKGTNTTDLGRVEVQAFSYKNNQPNCKYIVTSNFEKLRFYIEDATEFLEFNLFELTQDEFELMYLCLSSKSVESDIPLKLKSESVSQEDLITKKLYKDYSIFKRELFNNLTELNQGYDKLLLFKKSQKLLDRFLFLFFGEDKFLLPPNSVRLILDDWKDLLDKDVEISLYDRFKKYFGYLNTGFKGKRYDVFPYNGGLFKPDDVLDNILIDDELLYNHTKKLSEYDFESEVDVNILGHIFENSLNEIEEISNELISGEVVKSTSKRKKDGVFYTPKYITKYIVDNTIGKLCDEKKNELQINDEDYITDKKRIKKTIKGLSDKLNEYRNWLLELTICDPSCGSGAFLNQSLDFLIKEHRYVDELQSKLFGDSIVLSDIENSILENNLFGVDINEESVEITKLSLWLRTAQPNRKLNSLSSNIKCGNSLIDEPIEGVENYFKWEEEFPKVFEKGGFDVVIGNPPYIRKQGLVENYPELCVYYENKYLSATSNYDIYTLFMEESYRLINKKGIVSFILPHKFLISDFGVGIRKFFKLNNSVDSLVHFGSELVFKEASTYTCILNLTKNIKEKIKFKKISPTKLSESFVWDTMLYNNLSSENWDLQSQKVFDVIEKLKTQPYTVNDVFSKVFVGLQTSLDAVYVFEGSNKEDYFEGYNSKYDYHFEIEKELIKPVLGGKDVLRYNLNSNHNFVLFPYKKDGTPISEEYIKNNLPKTYSYLKHFETEIRGREKGKMDIDEGWYLYIYQKNHEKFPSPKIMTREISLGCSMTYDSDGKYYHNTKVYSFIKNKKFNIDEKYYLGILNSKLMWFFIKNTGSEYSGGYYVFKTNYIKPFPLPEISSNSDIVIENVNLILSRNKELQEVSLKFQRTLQRNFEIETLPKKLQEWYLLSYNEFLKELSKKKVKLSLEEEGKWEDFFSKQSEQARNIKNSIQKTDKEIDSMVYELYNLTDDEIEIIESTI